MILGEILCWSFLFISLVAGDHSAQPSYGAGAGFDRGGSSGFGGGASSGFSGGFGERDSLSGLAEAIPGEAGRDYPTLAEVPETSFSCSGQVEGGFYADPEAECQAFHICGGGGGAELTKYSFLCPNGSIFSQQYFICDWWFNVDCSLAQNLYSLNQQVADERAANSPDLRENNGGKTSGSKNGAMRGHGQGAASKNRSGERGFRKSGAISEYSSSTSSNQFEVISTRGKDLQQDSSVFTRLSGKGGSRSASASSGYSGPSEGKGSQLAFSGYSGSSASQGSESSSSKFVNTGISNQAQFSDSSNSDYGAPRAESDYSDYDLSSGYVAPVQEYTAGRKTGRKLRSRGVGRRG